jgi:AcrR family transcriptional regulator
MSAKQELTEARREQILDAAETVFSERGFDKARMDDIVRESGLSKGALYWYYKSKDALIQALLDRVFISEMQEAEALLETDLNANARLRMFIGYAVREYKRFEKLLPLAYEFVALAARSKSVRSTLVGYFRRYLKLLTLIIQEGVKTGEFLPCDAEAAAISLICMYEGMAMLWFIDPTLIDWDEIGDAPLETFLNGLRKDRS